MKLCRLISPGGGSPALGVVDGESVADLSQADLPADPAKALAGAGQDAIATVAESAPRHPLADVSLLAPTTPHKFLAIALNYADHIGESGMDAPEVPTFFTKQVTCVTGPGADVHMPKVSTLLDYEGELAVVIGKRCRHVSEADAPEVIAGYTIANDVSVRDWQLRTPTMMIGKSFDTHGPLGPWLVTADELGDPHKLPLRTFVNDEQRQDGNTADMIFNCFQQVSHLSEAMTLEPGDVIATGTPAGVGAAVQPFPEGLLKVGDSVRIEIDGIGELVNRVVAEPDGFMVGSDE